MSYRALPRPEMGNSDTWNIAFYPKNDPENGSMIYGPSNSYVYTDARKQCTKFQVKCM